MKDILIDFGLPAMILLICMILLLTGIDGEVKAIMLATVGWIFKSGYQRKVSNGKSKQSTEK